MLRVAADVDSRRGGILCWLASSFFVVFAILVMSGFFLFHTIKVREAGNQVNVDTPFRFHPRGARRRRGRLRPSACQLYPGAKAEGHGKTANVDLSEIFGDKDLHIEAGKWQTSDPIDKVQKYYEDKFPDMSVVQHNGEVEMHSVDRRGKRVIVLKDRSGSTEISLASVGEPKAN